MDLRVKNVLSWQKIWSSRQITVDIKEKLGNQEEVLRGGGISLIYMFFFISITFISIPSLSFVKKISIY